MWSDNDIDNAFRRLDPAEPEPTPFPLDAWLKLESRLDQAVIDRAVRHRLWQFFAAEVAIVALVGLGWLLWPTGAPGAVVARAQRLASTISPMSKTAATKRQRNPEKLGAQSPAAPGTRPAAGKILPAVSALLPATGVATGAAAGAGPLPAPETIGAGPHLPLAVAPAPGRHLAIRFYPAEGPRAVFGPGAGGAIAHRPEHAWAARAAGQQSAAPSLAATSGTGSAIPISPSASSSPAMGHDAAIGPMAAPSRAASEVAVASAASHGPGLPGAVPGAVPATAATGDLAPVAASAITPTRPAAEPLPAPLLPVARPPGPLPAVLHQPRFYVGLIAAPDVSTVKFADVQAPRLNVGLTLEYRLGPRWRVSTGLQRATKDYYARREDYDFSAYPKAYTRDFNWVDASCTILDVPLNLRYDAVVGPRYRVFGTAGLSSFFMQREHYAYDYYDNTSNAPAVWERNFVNANRHLFSVLNLSAGYEYGAGPHWRLQAEPYLKVPLAGVGAGKVKLLSAGVYFGLKYGF